MTETKEKRMSKNEIMIETVKGFARLPKDARQFVLGYMVAMENRPTRESRKPVEPEEKRTA